MLVNYFKISFRGLMKNPVNSFINVFGLSAAIGICVFAYAFAKWTYSTDQFHKNKHTVFLTTFFAKRDGTLQQYGTTPMPLGELLRQDFPQIQHTSRVYDKSVVTKVDDKVFHERLRFTDPEFLEMFTFPLKWGNASALKDVNGIILSEDMAVKYFGEQNPVGKTMMIKFNHEKNKLFTITGVAAEFPKSRTITFNFLVNFENLRYAEKDFDFHDWSQLVHATFIQVNTPNDIPSIEGRMAKYAAMQNEVVNEDWAISSFAFEPLATLHERAGDIRDDISRSSSSNFKSVIYMSVIAILMLTLACFNYINIAIASAAKRLKEIGIRKSIGATRRIVSIQFLTENIVITFIALFTGVLIAMTVFIPGFEYMFNFDMDFRLTQPTLWLYLPVILIATTLASGIYPSLYISNFQVVTILKGSVKFGNRNLLTKVLLCFQFILACIFITSAVMFSQNTIFMSKRSWGYEPRETLYALTPDAAGYEKLHTLLSQEPNVTALSGSQHHVGKSNAKSILHFADHEQEADHLVVDANYFDILQLKLKEGRTFNDSDFGEQQAVIINETLANTMAGSILGQSFTIDSIQYHVIGIVRDFHSYSFNRTIAPTIFTHASKGDLRYLSIKVTKGTEPQVYSALQTHWTKVFPDTPFDGGYQEDVWGFYFQEIKIHSIVWNVFAFIAVSMATLGLYGLVRFNVTARVKEFSIRKVLGAGIANLSSVITKNYLILLSISLVAGIPVSYLLTSTLITTAYEYHMPITYSGVIVASLILIVVVFVTIAIQISKVVATRPVDGLKAE